MNVPPDCRNRPGCCGVSPQADGSHGPLAFAERSLDQPRVRWVREGDRVLQVALRADPETVRALQAAVPDLTHALGCAAASVQPTVGGAIVALEGLVVPVREASPDQDGSAMTAGQGSASPIAAP